MRFAMVVIVDAKNERLAHESTLVQMTETANPEHQVVYVGEPCTVPIAEEYDTDQIRLGADGAAVTAWPREN